MDKTDIIIITGPTATGKTTLGARLAKDIGGEVVSADSMQIYKYMDIGTAKPTEDEKCGVPHHMIDIIPPWQNYSAARYVTDAARCVDDIISRGKTPVLVGGTGLYIDSLTQGREFSPRGGAELRMDLEAQYDKNGGESLLTKLRELDPESAEKLHANDKKRIVRALEVVMTTGKTISQHDMTTKTQKPRYSAKKIALTFSDRAKLYAKIDERIDTMMEKGLLDEVRGLLEMGAEPGITSMQAIGYKELVSVIKGKCDKDLAIDKIKMESRRYAKRQLTWLRRDPEIMWMVL